MSNISTMMGTSRNYLSDYFLYLEEVGLISQLRDDTGGIRSLGKVDKFYLDNPKTEATARSGGWLYRERRHRDRPSECHSPVAVRAELLKKLPNCLAVWEFYVPFAMVVYLMAIKLITIKNLCMKFYDREYELNTLNKNWEQSASHSMMTTMIGRRRIGKTSLLLKSVEGQESLYLYVSKDNEQMLCKKFQQQAERQLGLHIHGTVNSFGALFEELMVYGRNNHYTLIIDEFQNVLSINKAIPSEIQDIWDRYKDSTTVNLILCGSIYSMMNRIFENGDEPLYGRRDSAIRLNPFRTDVLRLILHDHNPNFKPDDLLCLYMLTGGVAKYVALLMDANATTCGKMLKYATASDSPFITEGIELLVSEFGRDYGTYFSILQLIAAGMTTQSEIDCVIGKNSGAYLFIKPPNCLDVREFYVP